MSEEDTKSAFSDDELDQIHGAGALPFDSVAQAVMTPWFLPLSGQLIPMMKIHISNKHGNLLAELSTTVIDVSFVIRTLSEGLSNFLETSRIMNDKTPGLIDMKQGEDLKEELEAAVKSMALAVATLNSDTSPRGKG